MLKTIKKISYITSVSRLKFFIIASAFILISISEAFGIGMVGPFIYLATNSSEGITRPTISWFYQRIGTQDPDDFVALLGILIILFFVVKSLSYWLIQSYVFRFSYEQERKLTKKLLNGFLSAPYVYHLSIDSSYIIHIIVGDVKKLSTGVLIPLLTIFANISVIICLSILLVVSNTLIFAIALLSLFPIFLLFIFQTKKVAHWGAEISKSSEIKGRMIYQALGGIREVKVIGCSHYFMKEVDFQTKRYVEAISRNFSLKITPRIVMETFFISLMIGSISFVLYVGNDSTSVISTLGIFALASVRMIPAFSNLTSSLITLRGSSYVIDKLYSDLKDLQTLTVEEPFVTTRPQYHKCTVSTNPQSIAYAKDKDDSSRVAFKEKISIENVSYRYPDTDVYALRNIDINFIKGESIAFIGKSGAGKTTLLDVLLGLLIPQEGDIKLDEQSIYKNLRNWQNLIGYIPQTIHLTDASIIENIAFGVPRDFIDYELLHKCVYAAQLESVIASLPEGLNTRVGERGVRLSGGQRQRVGIARALYHGSEILIMDEATSALDNETESLVTEAIKVLSGEKTIFVVAHRLSTIEHCDRVYMLEGGRIVKSGSFNEVVQH